MTDPSSPVVAKRSPSGCTTCAPECLAYSSRALTTGDKLFDNLDFQRAVQAYLLAVPAAANRNAIRTLGPVNDRTGPLEAAGDPVWQDLAARRNRTTAVTPADA
jgi:hypothetical protein